MLLRIDRLGILAQLKVQLRLRHRATDASVGDGLASLDRVAALHHDLVVMRVSRHPAIGVAHQHQVAKPHQLVARINNDTVFRRLDRRAARHRDVDPVIAPTIGLLAKTRYDKATISSLCA